MTMDTPTLKIKAFGKIGELVKSQEIEIAHVSDSATLLETLKEKYPQLAETTFSLAMNRRLVNGNTLIPEDAELALLPPFSGG
jgi:sulfur-carrier protein